MCERLSQHRPSHTAAAAACSAPSVVGVELKERRRRGQELRQRVLALGIEQGVTPQPPQQADQQRRRAALPAGRKQVQSGGGLGRAGRVLWIRHLCPIAHWCNGWAHEDTWRPCTPGACWHPSAAPPRHSLHPRALRCPCTPCICGPVHSRFALGLCSGVSGVGTAAPMAGLACASSITFAAGQRLRPQPGSQARQCRQHHHLVQAAGPNQQPSSGKGKLGVGRAPRRRGPGNARGLGAPRRAGAPRVRPAAAHTQSCLRAVLPAARPPAAGNSLEDRIASGEFTDAGSTKEKLTRPLRRILAKDPVGPGGSAGPALCGCWPARFVGAAAFDGGGCAAARRARSRRECRAAWRAGSAPRPAARAAGRCVRSLVRWSTARPCAAPRCRRPRAVHAAGQDWQGVAAARRGAHAHRHGRHPRDCGAGALGEGGAAMVAAAAGLRRLRQASAQTAAAGLAAEEGLAAAAPQR